MERWKQDLNNVTLSSSLDQRRVDASGCHSCSIYTSSHRSRNGAPHAHAHDAFVVTELTKLTLSEALNKAKKCLAF